VSITGVPSSGMRKKAPAAKRTQPMENRKRCRFIDDDADLSGSASDDENEEEVENEEDLAFIDDSQPAEVNDEEDSIHNIKIKRSERKIEKKELQYLLEDSGLMPSTVKDRKNKHKRSRPSSTKKAYKDDDETGWNSDDANFIASSDDDENEEDEIAKDELTGARVQKLLRDYVTGEGPLTTFRRI